jgi:GT2 family glycosyltransferase
MEKQLNKEIVYICIPTTPGRRDRLQTCIEHIRANDFPHAILIYENQDGGCVAAEHNMLQGIDGLVFILNDDMEIAPDCIRKLYEAYMREFGGRDGLVQPFEQIHQGKIAVSPFCHSDVIKKYVHRGYIHNFNDTELTEVMKARGKYLYVSEAKMVHRHWTREGELNDETYRLTSAAYKQDQALFEKRKANGFK